MYYIKSLDILVGSLGNEHPETGKIINNLGNLYLEQRQLEKASEYYNNALSIFQTALGNEHPEVAYI